MAVPRNRHSNARKNTRRAHHAKKDKFTHTCTNCAKPTLPHRVCGACGHYGGRSVVWAKGE